MPEIDVDFHDNRLSMNYWWPRMESLDVPTPETELVGLDVIRGDDTANLNPLISACDNIDADEYFLRGDLKSADYLDEGGFLNSTNEEQVEYVVHNLLSSVLLSDMPTRSIAVREQLNLDEWANSYGCPVSPEVRVFIDNGDVICYHLRADGSEIRLPKETPTEDSSDEVDSFEETEEDLLSILEEDESDDDTSDEDERIDEMLSEMRALIEDEWDEKIRPHAETVAEEFNQTGWSVDFLRTEDGEWYQSDMALYGLYYNEMTNNGWTSLSAHPPDCEHNLEENPPDNLPDQPKNARTERKIMGRE